MRLLVAYLGIGFVVCCVVAVRGRKKNQDAAWLVAAVVDPVWPLIFFWPLLVAIALVDMPAPKEEKMQDTIVRDFVGTQGIVICALRPLGKIQVGLDVVDARSDGSIVPEGSRVRVIRRSMSEWVVEAEPNQSPKRETGSSPLGSRG